MRKSKKEEQKIQFSENKYFLTAAIISFLVCVFFIVSYKITYDEDIFWHLAIGRFVVENKYVPDKDVFGHVTQGTEWIPFEWAFDVLSFSFYSLGGYNAVLVFRSLLLCLIFLLYLHVLKKLDVNSVISLIILFVLLFAMMDRFSARPHLMSYFFLTLMLYLYLPFKYLSRESNIKRLYWLPLIFLFWANMHMGVLIGALLLFILVISEVIIYYFPAKFSSNELKPLSKEHLRKFLLIAVACALMLLVNPHFHNTYIYTMGHLKMKMMESVAEWQNPFTGKIDINFIVTIYKILLFSGVIVLIAAYMKKDLTAALICIVFAIHSVRAIRFTVDYEIIVIPFLILSIDFLLKKFMAKNAAFWKVTCSPALKVIMIIIFAGTAFYAQNNKLYDYLDYYRLSGWGIDENYSPEKIVNFIKENNVKGTVFNQYDNGGYLLWNLSGEKNLIDSRGLSDEIYNEYVSMYLMKPGFESKLEKYGIDYVVFYDPELTRNTTQVSKSIVSYFSRNDNWKLVYWDDQSMLFLKNVPKFADIINRNTYQVLKPYNSLFQPKIFEEQIKNNTEQTKIEIERKSKTEPNGYLFRKMLTVTAGYVR